jgi:glycosyltransferase involved in cell wall biosynthesis
MQRIRQWEESGLVQYLSETDDVRPFMADADCIVLPSYREGVPHSLLEAAAIGRPIITTDVVGCKDVVDHHSNGFLCKVKNPTDLAEKMIQMVDLPHEQRLEMGASGRKKVIFQFDENIVIGKYLNAIAQLEVTGKGRSVQRLETTVESLE